MLRSNNVTYYKSGTVIRRIEPLGNPQGSFTVLSHSDSHTGSVVSNYAEKIRLRQSASSPYSMREITDHQPFQFYFEGLSGQARWSSDNRGCVVLPSAFTTSSQDSRLADMALAKLKRKLSNDVDQFKALVPLGEIRETRALIGQVKDATTSVLKSLIDIKRGNPRSAFRSASKAWLTFSFGVSPTISDINSLCSSIDSYLNRVDAYVRHASTAQDSWQAVYDTYVTDTNIGWQLRAKVANKVDVRYRYSCGINLEMRNANNYGVGDHFGLSFGELPSVAWELTPFSWVVDYFTTTGAFLEDLFEAPPGNTTFLTQSRLAKIQHSATPHIEPYTGFGTVYYQNAIEGKYNLDLYTRSVLSQLPHRSLRFKTADEIGVNSVKRLLNLASLLVK